MNQYELQQKFPFLTGVNYCDNDYVGIVQNQDDQNFSFYDVQRASSSDEKKQLLQLGEIWWWESNRLIPIDVFMFHEMIPFSHCLRTFTVKELTVLFGPTVSLQNLLKKRIKRRSIQLVKRLD